MLKLHIIQAEFGDCFLLEYGSHTNPKYILIDGGPDSIYDNHLKAQLQEIRSNGGKLDLAILSHIDGDHIIGLLDFFAELREQRANKTTPTIEVDALWHNNFRNTVGNQENIEKQLKTMITKSPKVRNTLALTNNKILSINQGNQLRIAATTLGIPINPKTPNNLICLDDQPELIIMDNLSLQIVGPTKQNLERLKKKWIQWLEKYEELTTIADPSMLAMIDSSVPNLSSIMFLAKAHGKTILFTGDGRGDHLIQGLQHAGLIVNGKLHVDILKLPHHGSDRDVDKEFFQIITADKYIISANGKYDNPSLSTLTWIVKAAKEQKRRIEIYITNETSATKKLEKDFNKDEYLYTIEKMEPGAHIMTLEIAK